MNLIHYTDKAIMKILLGHIEQMNPWLKIGERMTGPIASVMGGKIIQDIPEPPPTNLITLKTIPPQALPQPTQTPRSVTAGSVRVSLSDIENFRTKGLAILDFNMRAPGFLYPYALNIPSREWLEDYKVGDKISVAHVDPNTFCPMFIQTTLTQQMIDENSDVIFRFALSDH